MQQVQQGGSGYPTSTAPAPAASGTAGGGDGTYYAPPPGTDAAAENYAGAQSAYNRALIRFNQQRTGLLQQYGYKGTIDPQTGMVTNVGVDTGNSYGSLQQLLRNQANEDQAANNAAQDRGLVGGLANQGEADLAYAHHGQSAALANSLFGNLSDLNGQQLDAKSSLDQALWELQHSATTSAVDGGNFDPANVGPTDSSTPPPGGTSGAGAGAHGRTMGTPAQIAAASLAAYRKSGGKSSPASALAARSAGMNAAYGLAARAAGKKASSANAYTSGRKKRG